MEISYKKVGDYYIPEMVFPNAKLDKNLAKYLPKNTRKW